MAKKTRVRSTKSDQSWTDLLSSASTPLLLVDARRRIAFANESLAEWVGLPLRQILGRLVEYHSEPAEEDVEGRSGGVITGLCPPPAALSGHRTRGTLSCLGHNGRLRHRRGEFLPLQASPHPTDGISVLAVLELRDLTPEEVASSVANPPDADSLHRQLRRLRRAAAQQYGIASLVGDSASMRKVRTQVAAAARSRANVLITGRPGSGRTHVAKAIHVSTATGATTSFVSLDCRLLNEDQLRRGFDALRRVEDTELPTLLLLELGALPLPFQSMLADLLQLRQRECQVIATIDSGITDNVELDDDLLALIATISIELPPLQTRLEDLPLLVQLFLEQANVDGTRQVGSVSQPALELLALYLWPGEIDELQTVIAEAHAKCSGPELLATDLPAKIHHASQAALHASLPEEMIALEEFMAGIERELVLRAMEQADGNKSHAARLLGMTRPRLYRRLVQLGLLNDGDGADPEMREDRVNEGSSAD